MSTTRQKKDLLIVIVAIFIALTVFAAVSSFGSSPVQASSAQVDDDPQDHSVFTQLAEDFTSGSEVTSACLQCHDESAQEVMATSHWTWIDEDPFTGEEIGKQNVINNYCINPQSNEPRCTSCHVGYGYADNTFDFSVEENVDCLICHDTTGTYKKYPTAAGHPAYEDTEWLGNPWPAVDLKAAAQSVGASPSRANCGSCHFKGGGGDGVKHGDLDTTLTNPDVNLDVHMSPDGNNFSCVDCHETENHEIPGNLYSVKSEDRMLCSSCHSEEPHENASLNTHAERIACQACHIPAYARERTTKMYWDWTTAGQMNEEGKPYSETDENGDPIYDTKKGSFEWEANVQPEYFWFNGQWDFITIENSEINPDEIVQINSPTATRDDEDARIYPMKVFTGKQFYDTSNNMVLIPKLFPSGENGAATAYWKNWDWSLAFEAGMEYIGKAFSGELGTIDTEMYWLTTHMVAPADQSVQCNECHTENGRLDFIALGYSEDEAAFLSRFPPSKEEPTAIPTVEPTQAPPTETPTEPPPVPTVAAEEFEAEIEAEQPASNNTTVWFIVIGAIVVAGGIFLAVRKK